LRRLLVLTLLAAACSTPRVPAEEAQREIERVTRAVYLGNDRVKLTTEKPLLLNVEGMEFALLGRASSEALERGADSFAIVHAEYHRQGAFFSDDLPALGRTYIGSYERLLRHRDEEDQGLGRIVGATYVIKMHDEDDIALRQTFDSDETYDAMLDAWVQRRKLR
jgi:hypothetical protein